MSLNKIQLNAQQLVQLYGNVLIVPPATAAAPAQAAPATKQEAQPSPQPTPTVAPVMEAPATPAAPIKEAPIAAAPEPAAIRSLGGNAKGVLVLVQKESEAFLPAKELTFLNSILSACGLSLADIALVNITGTEGKNYSALTEHFRSRKVLLFDVTPVQLGMPINFPPFQVQAFKDCQYLQAPSLHLIESDVAIKKSLWGALKNLFQL